MVIENKEVICFLAISTDQYPEGMPALALAAWSQFKYQGTAIKGNGNMTLEERQGHSKYSTQFIFEGLALAMRDQMNPPHNLLHLSSFETETRIMNKTICRMFALRKAYFASVTHVDEEIGRVLDWLERNTFERDTITVLFSDHGMMLGDKDMWKKMVLFSPVTQVPFMIRTPGMTGQ